MKGACPDKCPFLYKELHCCTRPELNGRGVYLERNSAGSFIKVCSKTKNELVQKPKQQELNPNFCNPRCAYLEPGYGVCTRPELRGRAVRLTKDGSFFLRCCKEDIVGSKKESLPGNKYHAKKVTVDGITYDSVTEYRRYVQLVQLQKAGEISNLQYHVRYPLIDKDEHGREIAYEADFVYQKNGKTVVEDVKSKPTKTRLYALKKRLLLERYGLKITEYME